MVGYRRIYKIGPVVFIFTSLACALSRSLEMLTFARVAQGLGGAALMSVNTALIRLIYPQRLVAAWALTPCRCRLFGGRPDYRRSDPLPRLMAMAVLINVPLGIVAFVLAMRFLPPNSARSKIIRFDLPSAIMNALTFGLLITALSGFAGQSTQLVLAEVAAMLVVGFAASSRCPSLLPVDLLRIPLFSLYLHFHLLLLRADAGDGLLPFFCSR